MIFRSVACKWVFDRLFAFPAHGWSVSWRLNWVCPSSASQGFWETVEPLQKGPQNILYHTQSLQGFWQWPLPLGQNALYTLPARRSDLKGQVTELGTCGGQKPSKVKPLKKSRSIYLPWESSLAGGLLSLLDDMACLWKEKVPSSDQKPRPFGKLAVWFPPIRKKFGKPGLFVIALQRCSAASQWQSTSILTISSSQLSFINRLTLGMIWW